MSKFKSVALALATAGLLSAHVHAGEQHAPSPSLPMAQTTPFFSHADIQGMFLQGATPMQIASLSQQEMKETEGEWFWFAPIAVAFLTNAPRINQFAMNMLNTSAYQPWGHAFNWAKTQYNLYFK